MSTWICHLQVLICKVVVGDVAVSNIKILVVEDNSSLLQSIEEVLTTENYQTVTASDLDTAWNMFQQQLPDLVVTDVNLVSSQASDQSGITLMKRIKQQQDASKRCPVILMSSDPSNRHRLKTRTSDQVEFLTKPFDPQILLNTIAAHIASEL